MSGIFSGTLAAGLLATVAMVASGVDRLAPPAEPKASYDGQAFRLQVGGVASCVVERDLLDMRGSAALTLNRDCEAILPGLASARFWSEGADGAVAFTREDGEVVIEFAVADGVAYQSFQPGAPLASLIALN